MKIPLAVSAGRSNVVFYFFKSQVKKISEEGVKCLSNSNGIRTHNHLVCKRTLSHLTKLASCCHLNFRYCTCFEQGVL